MDLLISDSRVVFLAWFVGIAIVIAAALIFVEIRLKRKRVRDSSKKREKTPIDKMRIALRKVDDFKDKLDIVGRFAKGYFKEQYGVSARTCYSELSSKFRKKKMDREADFCMEMFEAYYSDKGLNDEVVSGLGDMLAGFFGEKKVVAAV
ncbi:MAG: hypothetical protein MI922_29540, partial [Bacteroidales bacterium]|nr:hypothetical protein [Bacteroidales bacterium]